EDADRRRDHGEQRKQRHPVDGRWAHSDFRAGTGAESFASVTVSSCAGAPEPFAPLSTWATIARIEGSMRERSGLGEMPMKNTSARMGAKTTISRVERSARLRFSSWVTGPKITRWYIQVR